MKDPIAEEVLREDDEPDNSSTLIGRLFGHAVGISTVATIYVVMATLALQLPAISSYSALQRGFVMGTVAMLGSVMVIETVNDVLERLHKTAVDLADVAVERLDNRMGGS